MKKKTEYLLSFRQGMVEVIKPDAEQDNSTPQQSVVWLENYNPNIQFESAVKRPGITYENTEYGTLNLNKYDGSIVADLDDPDYKYQDSALLGATSFVVSEPQQCDGMVVFAEHKTTGDIPSVDTESDCRNLETSVVSYLPHYNEGTGALEKVWVSTPITYTGGIKGFYPVKGLLQDFATYGETVLFTTLSPNTSTGFNTNSAVADESPRKRYAVYTYKFVNYLDFYKDDNLLMQGITGYDKATIEANKKLYNRWIVKYPSQITHQLTLGIYTTVNNTPVKLDDSGNVASGNLSDDICLIVFERDAQELKYEGIEGYGANASVQQKVAAPCTVTFTNPFIEIPTTVNGRHTLGYQTIEILNLPNLYAKAAAKVVSYPTNYFATTLFQQASFTPSGTIGIHHSALYVNGDYPGGNGAYFSWLTKVIQIVYNDKIRDTTTGTVTNIDDIAEAYPLDTFTPPPTSTLANFRIIENLIDYVNLNIPRLWIATEKINFVLIATINGIKVPLKEFVYIVRANDLDEYTSSISANQAAHPTFYSALTGTVAGLDNKMESSSYSLYVLRDDPGTGRRDVYLQLWGSMLPSSVSSSNDPFHGDVNYPVMLYTDVLHDATYDVPLYYPLEHCPQRFNHHLEITALTGGFNDPNILKKVRIGKYVNVTLAIKKSMIDALVQNGCTEVSVYGVQPDDTNHILRSVGLSTFSPVDGLVYSKEKSITTKGDYSKYALVKTFALVGKNEEITDYSIIKDTRVKTNSWKDYNASGTDYALAVPVQEGDTIPYAAVPPFDTLTDTDWTKEKTWTPDFTLWDYPQSNPLILNYSGTTWDGVGARCIAVVKGRTFIGGCYDERGIEEQAIVRYSIAQGAVISPDLFAEEDTLRVGHEPITALVEFREQLWVFNKSYSYRIQMRDIYDVTTWEFLEGVVQGAYHPKHIAVTPLGVVYANEGGVWLSDGADPVNIAAPILGTYLEVATNSPQKGQRLTFFEAGETGLTSRITPQVDEPQRIQGNGTDKVNLYMEVTYAPKEDELQIYFPMFTEGTERVEIEDNYHTQDSQYRLVYSFEFKNWRLDSFASPEYS